MEVTRVGIAAHGSHQVVEVGQRVPRDVRAPGTTLGVGTTIEGDVDQHVRVEQHQRYFRASAS